jgi:hypothetical protein
MAVSDLSIINNDISEFFGGVTEVLTHISQDKLDYISLFKGSFIAVNSWDLNVDLSIFDVLPNSVITVLDNNNQFSYSRHLSDNYFGLNSLDKDLIFQTPHANYITVIFKKSYKNVITDGYLLIWLSHKLKESDLSRLISNSLSSNVEILKVQDKNEIYLSSYYLNNGDVYYKYVPGLVSIDNTFNQVLLSEEEFLFNNIDGLFYPENGWYIFYQKTATDIFPLDLYQLVGLGFRRLRFNKTGSVFINTSNSYLQSDTPLDNNITSHSDKNALTTDRFIRLQGYFVYRNPTITININTSTAIGTVNVFDLDSNNCEDILTTAIFGQDSLNLTDFLDTEIFLDEESMFNECTHNDRTYPTQIGYSNNRNISTGGFNVNSEASSSTTNLNNTISFGRLVVYFIANTINSNTSVLNTYITIGNTFNVNTSTAIGERGILSSYGIINNINTSEAVSTLPFFSNDIITINRNTSSANFTFIKGLIATGINRQIPLASVQRYVIAGSITTNQNISIGFSFGSVPSGIGTSNHFNIATAEGLSGQLLTSSITNVNYSITTDLIVSYQGFITTNNKNTATSTSSVRYLAPISNTINNNSFVIIV